MSKRKILALIPNFGAGGAQRVFANLNKELNNNFDVFECAFDEFEAQPLYGTCGKVCYLEVTAGKTLFQKVVNFLRRIKALRRIKKKHAIDVCISHMEGANFINILSGGSLTFISVHGSKRHDSALSWLNKFLFNKFLIPILYRKADAIIPVSHEIKHELVNHFFLPEKIITPIPNFFSLDEINLLKEEMLSPEMNQMYQDNLVIVLNSRLALQKNTPPVLEIFSQVQQTIKNSKLLILGDGPVREKLIDQCKKNNLAYSSIWSKIDLDLSANVIFIGYQNNPFKFITKADMFLLTSFFEGFPLALCESMICGTLVLSSDCPTGPREILDPRSGFLHKNITSFEHGEFGALLPIPTVEKPETISQWTSAICYYHNHKSEACRIRIRAKERMKTFNTKEVMKQWSGLIESKIG